MNLSAGLAACAHVAQIKIEPAVRPIRRAGSQEQEMLLGLCYGGFTFYARYFS